jgi:hypothetical protein
MPKKHTKRPDNLNLSEGEQAFIAKRRLVLDGGRTKVAEGDVVILGKDDKVNIPHLLKIGAIESAEGGRAAPEEVIDE